MVEEKTASFSPSPAASCMKALPCKQLGMLRDGKGLEGGGKRVLAELNGVREPVGRVRLES